MDDALRDRALETAAQQYQVYSELRQLAPEPQPTNPPVVEPVRDLDYPVELILEIDAEPLTDGG